MTADTNTTQNQADKGHPVVIEGVEVPVIFKKLPLGDIHLDPENPRIQHAVRRKFKSSKVKDEDLLNLIYDQPGVPELMATIRDNGGLNEPIIVQADGLVIEGNCRAVSFLKLNKAKPDEKTWKTIPAFVAHSITERQVAILQGTQHVAGKNKWRAYEKVGHLYAMHKKLGMNAKEIARVLGLGRGASVEQDLLAYETMTQKLLPKMKGGNDLEKWSYVQEFYKSKGLVDYRKKPEKVDEFVSMVAEGRFTKGEQVRKLAQVLQVPSALRALKKKDMSEALAEASKVDPTVNSALMRGLQKTTNALKKMPAKDLQDLFQEESSRNIFSELVGVIRDAARAAKVKVG